MSKIGQKPVPISANVQLNIANRNINVKGSKGELNIDVPDTLEIVKENDVLTVKRLNERKDTKSLHGLYRSLIANAVAGVDQAWTKRLEVVGTGYNVKMQGQDLAFKVGYSHIVVFKAVPGITYQVEGNNKVVISGADKQLVGQVAYQIKIIKKPDVYKGKGIRYEGEKVRIKAGKKAKA